MTTNIPTEDSELRRKLEIMIFARFYDIPANQRTVIVNHLETLVASEVAKAELAMLERLTEPHHDTMHDTYDYDGIAESVINELNKRGKV